MIGLGSDKNINPRGQKVAVKELIKDKYNKNINPRGQKVAVKELIKDSSVATQNFLGEAKVMT